MARWRYWLHRISPCIQHRPGYDKEGRWDPLSLANGVTRLSLARAQCARWCVDVLHSDDESAQPRGFSPELLTLHTLPQSRSIRSNS